MFIPVLNFATHELKTLASHYCGTLWLLILFFPTLYLFPWYTGLHYRMVGTYHYSLLLDTCTPLSCLRRFVWTTSITIYRGILWKDDPAVSQVWLCTANSVYYQMWSSSLTAGGWLPESRILHNNALQFM